MLLNHPLPVANRRLHFYEKAEEIPLPPQGVWQVSRGIVQLYSVNRRGEETVLGWAQPGNFFGSWFTNLRNLQARALSEVYLQWFSQPELLENPLLCQQVLRESITRIRQSEQLLVIASLKRVEHKLIRLLKLLAQYLGEKEETNAHTVIPVRITHQMMASAIGTTRVTVTRLLGELQKKGIIAFNSQRYLVIYNSLLDANVDEV
ncbi:MAG: Crp/Fnr family transcriptional regulator [Geminocystis sp.]|nr:Crp/Fnr family transcriptional regulator [Geminocystis sp.]MCS7146765.1 Crp/Fnr family transcriptional regulator [Geminocystis sp.]MCX8077085.1 Crp/Fnr family transcriptional regulator [Geminocystis sp.]MDW8115591.1 Crp/Fnr family transcriptional regulator [Geminocystis sp.]HIK36687.1 Crp/Fnr family transcriptional regulator [Geminocystis sp. M7585_C2015_104]